MYVKEDKGYKGSLSITIGDTEERWTHEHAHPEEGIGQTRCFPDGLVVAHPDQGQLEHLQDKQVQTHLACHHHHHQLVHARRQKECRKRRIRFRKMERLYTRIVHMAEQKVVHWLVPLARPLVKTDTVPPVLIKVAVRETNIKKERQRLGLLKKIAKKVNKAKLQGEDGGMCLPAELGKGVANALENNVEYHKVVHHKGYQEQNEGSQG